MLTFVKLAVILFTVSGLIRSGDVLPLLAASLPVIAALWGVTGEKWKAFLLRNIPILLFSAIFTGFLFAAGGLLDAETLTGAAANCARIVLVYNLVFLGMRWLGRTGLSNIVLRAPSRRVRIYLLLLFAVSERLLRNSVNIIRQLSLRVPVSGRGRILLARYYFRNLIMHELSSVHFLQAAAVTRLHVLPQPRAEERMPGAVELLLLAYSAAFLAVTVPGVGVFMP